MSPRLLVVDDEESLRFVYKRYFARSGYEVVTACDGVEALMLLDTGLHVDAIILDNAMPAMTGSSFLAQLHQRPLAHLHKRVLFMSAVIDEVTYRTLVQSPFIWVITPKPLSLHLMNHYLLKMLSEVRE